MTANALLVIVSFLVGWVALWPARRALGAWEYHLAALPVGLLGWTAAVGLAGLLARPMDLLVSAAAVALYVAAVFAALTVMTRGPRTTSPPAPAPWTFVAALCVTGITAAASAAAGLTVANYDSWSYYHVLGVGLSRNGVLTPLLMGARSPLIPAVIAGGRLFGADWVYAVYPVMALNLAALLLRFAWTSGVRRLGPTAGGVLLALLGLSLVTLPSFLLHAVFVHSQMYSALYLLLAVGAIVSAGAGHREATGPAPNAKRQGDARALSLLLIAGLATSGLALARPDGLAYMFVPMLLVIAMRFGRGWSRERLAAYWVPLLVVLAVSYGPAFVRLHFWSSGKLSGRAAFAILVVAAALPVVAEALAGWDRTEWLRRKTNAVRLALAVDVLVMGLAASAAPRTFAASLRNMAGNLLSAGGYGYLWFFLFGVLAVTVAFGAARRGETLADLLFVAAQFLAVALVVHGLSHPGRLSPGDSFNRVAFHLVPILLWYTVVAVSAFLPRRPSAAGAGDDPSIEQTA